MAKAQAAKLHSRPIHDEEAAGPRYPNALLLSQQLQCAGSSSDCRQAGGLAGGPLKRSRSRTPHGNQGGRPPLGAWCRMGSAEQRSRKACERRPGGELDLTCVRTPCTILYKLDSVNVIVNFEWNVMNVLFVSNHKLSTSRVYSHIPKLQQTLQSVRKEFVARRGWWTRYPPRPADNAADAAKAPPAAALAAHAARAAHTTAGSAATADTTASVQVWALWKACPPHFLPPSQNASLSFRHCSSPVTVRQRGDVLGYLEANPSASQVSWTHASPRRVHNQDRAQFPL